MGAEGRAKLASGPHTLLHLRQWPSYGYTVRKKDNHTPFAVMPCLRVQHIAGNADYHNHTLRQLPPPNHLSMLSTCSGTSSKSSGPYQQGCQPVWQVYLQLNCAASCCFALACLLSARTSCAAGQGAVQMLFQPCLMLTVILSPAAAAASCGAYICVVAMLLLRCPAPAVACPLHSAPPCP